jgi:hypothetical protein
VTNAMGLSAMAIALVPMAIYWAARRPYCDKVTPEARVAPPLA